MTCGDLFLGLLAVIFPPIAVWVKRGAWPEPTCIRLRLANMIKACAAPTHSSTSSSAYSASFRVFFTLGTATPQTQPPSGQLLTYMNRYIIAKFPEEEFDYERVDDAENQRVTYYYVNQQPGPRRDYGTQGGGQGQAAPKPSGAPKIPQDTRPAPAGPSVGAGSSEAGAPPSYSDVVKGDNKVQNQE